jgi:hypothetical protein
MSELDARERKSPSIFVWKARPTYRIGVNAQGFTIAVKGRLAASAKAHFGDACQRPDLQSYRPGRMIAYPKAQTTVYSKSIVELMIKATKEISSWRRV